MRKIIGWTIAMTPPAGLLALIGWHEGFVFLILGIGGTALMMGMMVFGAWLASDA